MVAFLDACRFIPTAGGTTDWTYSSTVGGYQSPSAAGAINGALYRYRAESSDLTQWEIGVGTYSTATGVLTRTAVFYNSLGTLAKISFSTVPQVAIVALSSDLLSMNANTGAIRSYLAGCGLSNDGTAPNTKLDYAAGCWSDDTNAAMFNGGAGVIDFATTGANGMDTGSLPTSGTVHIFGIGKPDGTTACLGSTVLTPTMPTGYTFKRRIGSWLTDASAHLLKIKQLGDVFLLDTPQLNVTAFTGSTAIQTASLSAPAGLQVEAIVSILGVPGAAGDGRLWVFSPDQNSTGALANTAQTINAGINVTGSSSGSASELRVRTNASSQIKFALTVASATTYITTQGWTDRRGRDS